jgi:Skp family chaperone for outer membrane proteins
MSKYVNRLLLAFGLLLGLSGQAIAQQELGQARIMIVDFQRVQNESLVGQDYASQLNSARLSIETKEGELVQELLADKDELDKQKNIIAQEALQQRARELDQKAQQAEALVKQLRRDLNVSARQATLEIQRVLKPIVVAVMNEQSATIVVDKAVVYHFTGALDTTSVVIDRLNSQITTLKTEFPDINAATQ